MGSSTHVRAPRVARLPTAIGGVDARGAGPLAAAGRELGTPAVTNIWVPDGYKDTPADRKAPRQILRDSLDKVLGLDQQAVNALKRWTWKPGTRDGEPVKVAVQVQITFTLK